MRFYIFIVICWILQYQVIDIHFVNNLRGSERQLIELLRTAAGMKRTPVAAGQLRERRKSSAGQRKIVEERRKSVVVVVGRRMKRRMVRRSRWLVPEMRPEIVELLEQLDGW